MKLATPEPRSTQYAVPEVSLRNGDGIIHHGEIYLDHAATSPLRRDVWEAMEGALEHSFNPASSHAFGRRAHRCLELARTEIAELLGCDRAGVYFTGGGTQSDNLAILGFARSRRDQKPRIFVSAIEHPACLESAEHVADERVRVAKIPVDGCAAVDIEWLERSLAEDPSAPTLVSVMWANNEVGAVQPMAEIVELAHSYGAVVHTDAVQALGKVPVRIDETPVDMLSATAHKLGGPVGVGILYCRKGLQLEPLSFGGGQERSLWPGTQNPIGAVGFVTALRFALDGQEAEAIRWTELRNHFERRLLSEIPGARIHAGEAERRLPQLVSLGIDGCDAGALLVSLDLEGIAISGGSACSSGSGKGSSVLTAMGVESEGPYATLRFSFGHDTTREQLDAVVDTLVRVAARVLALSA
ncbi:MAG: cysteine desulfurase family protein [Gemmatimonadota bacterium]